MPIACPTFPLQSIFLVAFISNDWMLPSIMAVNGRKYLDGWSGCDAETLPLRLPNLVSNMTNNMSPTHLCWILLIYHSAQGTLQKSLILGFNSSELLLKYETAVKFWGGVQ